MDSSGLPSSSPIKAGGSQYIPSLFATNAQSGIDISGSSRHASRSKHIDVGGYSHGSGMQLERTTAEGRARDDAAYPPIPPVSGSTMGGRTVVAPAVTGAPPPAAALGTGSYVHPGTAQQRGSTPSPVSTIDYADIEQKQTELRSAVEYRIHSLESTLTMRDEEIVRLRAQLRKMEEDYQFNYNLIGERDAALEEAAQQLQRLYREMKRVTNEAGLLEKRLQAAESEQAELKKRVRDAEATREATVTQVKKEYAIKEEHLAQTVKAKESALEEERQRSHEEYMKMMKELEETKAETEGRTASVSSQLEQRHKQVVQRLENELERLQKRLQTCEADKTAAEAQRSQLKERCESLQHQMELAAQRNATAVEEMKEANQKLEAQVAQTTSLLNKSLATAEDAIREETQKSSRLELENTGLQSRLAETKAQLQEAQTKQIEDTRSFAEERRAMQANYQSALSAMEETEKKWRDGERALQSALAEKTDEVSRLLRKLQEAQQACEAERGAKAEAKESVARLQQEVDKAAADAQRWKDEEAKTAAGARHEKALAEEKHLALERAAQEARDENERQRRKMFDLQERSQTEVARLTRELHASEAARRALEDQFHLTQDRNGQNALINGLRYEKEVLEKRVMELERTNGEIREQVANFTLELQNDPVVKSAKESQRKVQELQQELLTTRDELQRVRDTLTEKDEEVARYQVDILRAQMLLGTSGSPDADLDPLSALGRARKPATNTLSEAAATMLRKQQEQLRGEWATMREQLEKEMRGGAGKRKQKVRRQRSASSSSSSISTSSSSSSSSSSSASSSPPFRVSRHTRKHSHRRKHHRDKPVILNVPASPEVPPGISVPPPLPGTAEDPGQGVRHSYLLQESEVWRQKSLQLEQHLRTVLRERDQLRRELGVAKQDISALTNEKQSLLDLNSLLKAQLREAYRSSYEREAHPPVSGVSKEHVYQHPEGSRAAAAGWEDAPLGNRSEPQQTQRPPRAPHTGSPTPALSSRSSHPSRDASDGRHTTTRGTHSQAAPRANAGLNSSSASSHQQHRSGTPRSPSVQQYESQQQRLAELEEEIRNVRGQIATTTAAAAKRQASAQSQSAPVFRKGGAAVRHYGFHQ